MTHRLLNRIEPAGFHGRVLLAAWIGGGIAGTVVAIAALLVLTGAQIGP
jgi:hypothetical protein